MRRFLCGAVVLFAVVVANGSSATAAPRAIATGTWDCTVATDYAEGPHRTAGGNNTIFTWSATGCAYAGDLSGTFSPYGTRVVKRNGSFADHGMIVCTGCTLAGRTGDFTGVQDFRGTPDDFRGTISVRNAMGRLAGLRAKIRFRTTSADKGTYTIRYSFKR